MARNESCFSFVHFNNSVALFNRVYYGGGDTYITKKVKYVSKYLGYTIFNTK